MKTKKRFSLTFIALTGLLVLASCDFAGGGSVDKTAANRQVLDAVNKMATTNIHSFELDLSVDVAYEGEMSDPGESRQASISAETNTSLEVKVSHLFEDDAKASAELSTSLELAVSMSDPEEEDFDMDISLEGGVAAYLKDGWAYADLTDVMDLLLPLMGLGEIPEKDPIDMRLVDEPEDEEEEIPTKIKYEVGNLFDALELEGEYPATNKPINVDEALPYISDIRNVSVKKDKGGINVVYVVTMDDVVDVVYRIFEEPSHEEPSSETESTDDPKDMIRSYLEDIVTIKEAKLTIGVGSDGFLSKLYIDVDVDVSFENEGETQSHSLEAGVHLDIANINKTVSVSFPDDLDDYYELNFDDSDDF